MLNALYLLAQHLASNSNPGNLVYLRREYEAIPTKHKTPRRVFLILELLRSQTYQHPFLWLEYHMH